MTLYSVILILIPQNGDAHLQCILELAHMTTHIMIIFQLLKVAAYLCIFFVFVFMFMFLLFAFLLVLVLFLVLLLFAGVGAKGSLTEDS